MIEFIDNPKSFAKCKMQKNIIFQERKYLPKMVFNKKFNNFLFTDFDYLFEDSFFLNLSSFLKKNNSMDYIFYVDNPNPETYFYKHFKKFNVSIIPIDSEIDSLNDFLFKDPGNSPADAIMHNSFDFFLFSNNNKWGITASRDLDIAIIGFNDIVIKDSFLKEFQSDKDYIDDLESFEKNIDVNNDQINLLIKNYK